MFHCLKLLDKPTNKLKRYTMPRGAIPASTTRSFSLFPNLPLELPRHIWKLALHNQHFILEVIVDAGKVRPAKPPSAILQANQESRKEALHILTSLSFHRPNSYRHTKMYIHPPSDALYLRARHRSPAYTVRNSAGQLGDEIEKILWNFGKTLLLQELAIIQHLVIDLSYWQMSRIKEPNALSIRLADYWGLKTLTFVMGNKGWEKGLGDKVLVHCAPYSFKDTLKASALIEGIIENTTRLSGWERPKAQVVVPKGF